MKIAIDAGHYIGTPGKRCLKSIDEAETREWTLNGRIADILMTLLDKYDCQTLRVDDATGKREIGLDKRCRASNEWGADIYISIHHNAGINGGSGGGTVVFYKGGEGRREQAKRLYDNLIAQTGLAGNRSSKVVDKGYYVLIHTSAPAFLIENGFMDSKSDTPIILTREHAEKSAKGICNFLVNEYKLKKKETENMKEEKIYNAVENIPDWGKKTVEKLIEKKFLYGGDNGLGLTENMLRLLVINDRAGLYD